VEEVARLLAIHKNTVRQWMKLGLETVDNKRPVLILGRELAGFLRRRRVTSKRPCQPGQMYCVCCRAPKFPAAGMVDYVPLNEKVCNLTAICPDCNSVMHRCVSTANLVKVRGQLDITLPQAPRHINEISQPSVNSDLKGDD
jgi:hypothetical protein